MKNIGKKLPMIGKILIPGHLIYTSLKSKNKGLEKVKTVAMETLVDLTSTVSTALSIYFADKGLENLPLIGLSSVFYGLKAWSYAITDSEDSIEKLRKIYEDLD